jgi:hypothetical protein
MLVDQPLKVGNINYYCRVRCQATYLSPDPSVGKTLCWGGCTLVLLTPSAVDCDLKDSMMCGTCRGSMVQTRLHVVHSCMRQAYEVAAMASAAPNPALLNQHQDIALALLSMGV